MFTNAKETKTHLPESDWERVDESSCPKDYAAYLEWAEESGLIEIHRGHLFGLLPLKSSDHILDAGCGLGAHARALAKRVGKDGSVTGIDKSEVMIRSAREKKVDEESAPLQFDIGNICSLPYADESFDGIISDRVFMHLEHPMGALAEFKRVLKPKGWVAISEPDWSSFKIQPDSRSARLLIEAQASGFRNGSFGREIGERFTDAGFRVLQDHHLSYNAGSFDLTWQMLNLERAQNRLIAESHLTEDDIDLLKADLKQADIEGRLSMTSKMHFCLGQKKGSA